MKKIFLLMAILAAHSFLLAQDYAFERDFVAGTIYLKDTTAKRGYIMWDVGQNSRLIFKQTESGGTDRYTPKDLLGFQIGKQKFVSLHNVEVCMDAYALLGAKGMLKHVFGERLHAGPVSVYLVVATVYDQINDLMKPYHNYVFEKTSDTVKQYVAYPLGIRMTPKKYKYAKNDLYKFFADNPAIIARLRAYQDEQDDFREVIEFVKKETAKVPGTAR